ncbi:hypothetical protein [Pontibacter burrus]|uniref:Uncharacterized protein n=1 Tax=Pontibacter burrus TaxID=2704466 RepID=A0A6B3LUM5_9BACT|nr:hypothetical protein [Pontibacter burrus]NEM97204.1 hypothetical protein [Pontibacter burrus]
MKFFLNLIAIAAITFGMGCNEGVNPVKSDLISNGKPSKQRLNIDSLAQVKVDSLLRLKLGNIKLATSFERPESNNIFIPGDNMKDELYVLPGMIMQIRRTKGAFKIEETGYYVRKPKVVPKIEIKFDKPFFRRFIDKSFSSNIETMSSVAATLSANDRSFIEYKTIQVSILNPDELDMEKADSIISKLTARGDTTIYGYFIVRSANLNSFSYNTFTKVTGNVQANGLAFQSGSDIFVENGSEQNNFEVVLKGISRDVTYLKFNKIKPATISSNKSNDGEVANAMVRLPEWVEFKTPVEMSVDK